MGRIKKFALIGAALLIGGLAGHFIVQAMVVKYNNYLVNETGLTFNKTYPLPLNSYGVDNLSFSSSVSSASFTAATFTDGQESTGTITLSTTSGLASVAASDFMTIVATTAITSTHTLVLNGVTIYPFNYLDSTLAASAVNIKNALAAAVSNVSFSTGASSTIYSTATVAGVGGNNMSYTTNFSTGQISFNTYTSSGATGATSQFSGGKDPATLSINGFNIAFTVTTGVSGSTTTQVNIATAINNTSILNTQVVASTGLLGVITTTSTAVGSSRNYVITSSSDAALTVGGSTKTVTGLAGASIGQMWGGADSSAPIINPATTTTIINISAHGLTTALPVLLSTSASSNILAPLVTQTTYYVIPLTANSISLATTSAAAQAGTAIVITSSKTTTSKTTFTLTPLAIAGNPSFRWEISNDGTNWFPYLTTSNNVSVSSVTVGTYVSTGTYNSWDFGTIGYAFIRLSVVAPTQGAVNLKVIGNGKNTGQFP